MFGFVVLLTLVVGLMLGLLPALRITRTQAATGLREQGRGIAGSAAWLRVGKLVVVGQLALSLPLLVGAGLLVRTLVNLQHVDLGYASEAVLTVRVDAQAAGYEPARQTAAFEALLDADPRACPACAPRPTRTTASSAAPTTATEISVEGYTPDRPTAIEARATTRSGRATSRRSGMPVLLGREITEQDRPAAAWCA